MGASQPKPHTRLNDWGAICRALDKDMNKPEVVYKFTGTEKTSTDRSGGVYASTGLCTFNGQRAIGGTGISGCMIAGKE